MWYQRGRPLAYLTGLLMGLALFLIFSYSLGETENVFHRRPLGFPQLVSVDPLPEIGEAMCEWTPASASSPPLALQQGSSAPPSSPSSRQAVPSVAVRTAAAKRGPVRVIRDPYAAYSAVAVDPVRNEVILTDENLFSILTYDRLENTPLTASMSEPKRMIRGENTQLEYLCSVYVDPVNGDIYALNNDTTNFLNVFSRQARGDTAPIRSLETPHTTFGIAVDEKNQEILLTIQDDAAVLSYRKAAQGKDSPIRVLQGEHTQMADPHGIALDPKNDLIFVTNWGTVNVHKPPESGPAVGGLGRSEGKENWPIPRNYSVPGSGIFLPPSITVYTRGSSGDTAPLRVIQGPKTQLNWPTAVAVDPERGELFVANDPTHSILVFRSDAHGDVAPIRVLQGPKTYIQNPTGVYLDLKNDELWVANFGNHSATVYRRGASGDTPPLRMIRSGPLGAPTPVLGNAHALAYDSRREEILVSN